MKFIPNSVTRLGSRSMLKASKHSPTILVVSGVVGLAGTAVLAARATLKLQPILDEHAKQRAEVGYISKVADKATRRAQQRQTLELYVDTAKKLTKLYGPTVVVGTVSTASILTGHKILRTRHLATMAAYSGLSERINAYRERVAGTVGAEMEKTIWTGAQGEYTEDPNHPGEYKLEPKYTDNNPSMDYLRPWFDETATQWVRDAGRNYNFLKGVQNHCNNMLRARGHLFLSEVLDALDMPRTSESIVMGWIYEDKHGISDSFVDFGFMSGTDPATVAFRNGAEKSVRLNFNVADQPIWNLI
jgi:hypothetical protein